MVLSFALFGFPFLATQYLQFVLGFSPSAAGLRVLPYAGALIVFAPLSAKLVLRYPVPAGPGGERSEPPLRS